MPEANADVRPPRGALSRQGVVLAAIEAVDEAGLSALSMRRLGERLDVEAMSLYHYVNGREDLLEAMVAHLVDQLRLDPERSFPPSNGWQAYLQWLAHAVRAVALDHPLVFPLIATRHPAAPWLRPPLRSLDVVEDFLTALLSRGFTDDAVVAAYRIFSSFLLGHLLLEVAALGAETSPDDQPMDEGRAEVDGRDAELTAHPQTRRLKARLVQHDADAEFEQGLEHVLDRLDFLLRD